MWVGRAAGIRTRNRSRRTVVQVLRRIVLVSLLHADFLSNSELMTQS